VSCIIVRDLLSGRMNLEIKMSTDGGPLEVAGLEVVEVATLEDVNEVSWFYIYIETHNQAAGRLIELLFGLFTEYLKHNLDGFYQVP